METLSPSQRFLKRNMPCLSRTPGSTTPINRSLPKEVFLHEWWLVRAAEPSNGKNLQVSGFTYRGQVKELFHSAPIMKRHATDTLETEDGITVSTCGLINRFRTLEKGFSKEVCDKFLLGFPFNWEDFATVPNGVSSSEMNPHSSEIRSSSNYTLPVAFEDRPAVAIPDVSMSIPEDSENSHASAGVDGNMNTASEKCLESGCAESHASKTKSQRISVTDGHIGSLVGEFEGNKTDPFVDFVVPQSCNKSEQINVQQKKRGRPPPNDTSNMRMTRSMKRQRNISLEDTLATTDGITEAVVLETPKKESHTVNTSTMADGVVLETPKKQSHAMNTSETTCVVALETPKKQSHITDDGVVLETPTKQSCVMNASTPTDGFTAAVTLETPKKESDILLARCQVPSKSNPSKLQDETEKVEKSSTMTTLRRSSRLENTKK